METKKITHSTHRQGEVKVVNAVASIYKILEEMAPDGKLNCQMENTINESSFVFVSNGVCATFHVQTFAPIQEGGVK